MNLRLKLGNRIVCSGTCPAPRCSVEIAVLCTRIPSGGSPQGRPHPTLLGVPV